MKKISIKTVDGNRFDFTHDGPDQPYKIENNHWIVVKLDGVTRWFLIDNIVSITEKEVDDG